MRLLDYSPWTGIATYHEYDHASKTTTIVERGDASPVLDHNKAFREWGDTPGGRLNPLSRAGIKNSWWWVAQVPPIVQMKWLREKGVDVYQKDHWPAVKKLLNDSEYAYLRTGTGRV